MKVLCRPMAITRDLMAQDPGVIRGVLRRRVKLLVAADDSESLLEHAKNLPRQGELLWDTPDLAAAKVWLLAVGNLTSSISLKFRLNAASDTFPHNCNLKLRGRRVSSACPLCGQHQTLHHVLNHCPVALELRKYRHRHDAVLKVIDAIVQTHLTPLQQMIADLHTWL